MRFLVLALVIATPTMAHTVPELHVHSIDWALPVALVVIGTWVIGAWRKPTFARARK